MSCEGKLTPKTLSSGRFKSPVSSQFKSPLNKDSVKSGKPPAISDLKKEVQELKKKLQDCDTEISLLELGGFQESELQTHIDKLHEYNEIKDVGQMVLGRIATVEGVQTKDLYARYNLELTN